MWWEIGSLTLLSLKELHLAIAVKSMSPNILYPTQSTDQQSWWGFQQCWKFQSMSNHEPCWPQTTGILEAFWPETISKRRYTTNFDTISSSRHLGTAETTIYGQKVDGIDWTHPFWARPASHRSFLEQTDVDIDNVRHAQLAEHSKHTNSRGMFTANQIRCPWVVSEGFNILTTPQIMRPYDQRSLSNYISSSMSWKYLKVLQHSHKPWTSSPPASSATICKLCHLRNKLRYHI